MREQTAAVTDSLTPFPDDWSTALCIAAHPDDLEYGTASAVAAWTAAGKTVSYLLGHLRRSRHRFAGSRRVRPDSGGGGTRRRRRGRGRARSSSCTTRTASSSTAYRCAGTWPRSSAGSGPTWWSTSSPDPRPVWGGVDYADHRAVGLAGVDAARDAGNRWVFRDLDRVRSGGAGAVEGAVHRDRQLRASHPRRRRHRHHRPGNRLTACAPPIPGGPGGVGARSATTCCAGSRGCPGERFGGRLAVNYELLG